VIWFTPEGTQIKEEHVYHDVGTIMSQIGVSKQKARPIPAISQNPPQVFTPTGSADEQKNVDASNKMMASFEKKSEADFIGGVADNVEWDDMTQPETMKGKESGKKFFKMITTAFPDVKIVDSKSWAVGDYVLVESAMQGYPQGRPLRHDPADEEEHQPAWHRHHPVQGRKGRPRLELRQQRRADDAARSHGAEDGCEGADHDGRADDDACSEEVTR